MYMGKEGRDLMHIMPILIEVMKYVHFSDRYTPEEKELALFGEVLLAMVHKS